jgi:hypothetical protein
MILTLMSVGKIISSSSTLMKYIAANDLAHEARIVDDERRRES